MELEGVRSAGAWPFWGRYPLLEAGEKGALCSWLCPPERSFRHSHLVRGQVWGAWRKEAFPVSDAINSCCSNQDLVYFLFKMFIYLLCSLRINFGDVKSVFYSFHQLQCFTGKRVHTLPLKPLFQKLSLDCYCFENHLWWWGFSVNLEISLALSSYHSS